MSTTSKSIPIDQSLLPLSLTADDLASFNRFWLTLNPSDQVILYELIQKAAQYRRAIDHSGYYLTFNAFLLSLVLEQHKEVRRLHNLLDGNGWYS